MFKSIAVLKKGNFGLTLIFTVFQTFILKELLNNNHKKNIYDIKNIQLPRDLNLEALTKDANLEEEAEGEEVILADISILIN